ncbi:hypothetical protein ACVW1A_006816 [Bradyrhizobium sp. LB1.3]
MASILRKTAAAEQFRVPSLAEADQTYAALLAKSAELHNRQSVLRDEINAADKQLRDARAAPGERLSDSVAALLGDAPDSAHGLRKNVVELRRQAGDVEAATEIQRRRITEAKSAASGLVVAQCRDEYRRRCAAVAKAASALHEARMAYLDLKWQFEAEDVSWTSLGPLSIGFLGDHTDGQLVALSKGAGNV